jgi:hypothetical protein
MRLARPEEPPTAVSKPAIDVDAALWPLVVIRYDGKTTPADWERMFAIYRELHRRGERFYTLNDGRCSGVPSAVERAVIGRHTLATEAVTRKLLIATCIVIDNALIRGALTAIHWLAPPAYSTTVVASVAEGYVVAAEAITKDGKELHPEHARLVRSGGR